MIASELNRALLELAGDTTRPLALREQAVWVVGHGSEQQGSYPWFFMADDDREPKSLRRVAALVWFLANPAAALQQADKVLGRWPAEVVAPTVSAMCEEIHHDTWRQWCQSVAQHYSDLALEVALILGDLPDDPVMWIFMAETELDALMLPAPDRIDWERALVAGQQWEEMPPADPFSQQAVQDAQRWATRTLQMRVAERRYLAQRQWEYWLEQGLGQQTDTPPASTSYHAIRLADFLPAGKTTARGILGALAIALAEQPDRGRLASNRLRSQTAAVHLRLSETYQNAAITRWHVGGLTGQLRLFLMRQVTAG